MLAYLPTRVNRDTADERLLLRETCVLTDGVLCLAAQHKLYCTVTGLDRSGHGDRSTPTNALSSSNLPHSPSAPLWQHGTLDERPVTIRLFSLVLGPAGFPGGIPNRSLVFLDLVIVPVSSSALARSGLALERWCTRQNGSPCFVSAHL